MWPRLNGERRSQSEILGTILVFSLVIIVGTVLVTAGIALFDDASQEFENRQGQDGVQEINNRLSGVGDAGTVIDVPQLGEEGTSFDRDAGNVTINVTTKTEAFTDASGNTRLIDASQIAADDMTNETSFELGEIVHESDGGVNTVFQGGLLFESERDEVSILDEPSFDFVKGEGTFRSIDLSFVSLSELENLNSETYVERDDTESTEISRKIQEMVRNQRQLTGIPDRDPTASVFINVSIETEYPEAWERYVTERMSVKLADSQVDINGNTIEMRFPEFVGNDLEAVDFPKNVVYSGKAGVASVFYTTDEFDVELENRDTGFEVEEFETTPPTIGGGADEYAPVIAEDGEWWVYDPTASNPNNRWVTVNDTETRAWSSMSGIDYGETDRSTHEWGFTDAATTCMVGFDSAPSSPASGPTEHIQEVVADGQCGEVVVGANNPPEQEPEMEIQSANRKNPGPLTQGSDGTVEADINNDGDAVVKNSPVGLFGDLGGDEKQIIGYGQVDLYPFESPTQVDLDFTATKELNTGSDLEVRTIDDTEPVPISISNSPKFEVDDVRPAGDGAVPGEKYDVEADITNTGADGEGLITLTDRRPANQDDWRAVNTTTADIDSGDTQTVTLTWNVPLTADPADPGSDPELRVSVRNNNDYIDHDVPRRPEALIKNIDVPNIDNSTQDSYADTGVSPIEVTLTNPSRSKQRTGAKVTLDTTKTDLLGSSGTSSSGGNANPTSSDTVTVNSPYQSSGTLDTRFIDEVDVEIWGAKGEGSEGAGGNGGKLKGTIDTSSIDTLEFDVGDTSGNGGDSGVTKSDAGNGGGSTEIKTGTGTVIAVADGGGGGGNERVCQTSVFGFCISYSGTDEPGGDGGAQPGDRSISTPPVQIATDGPTGDPTGQGGDGGGVGDNGEEGGWFYDQRYFVDVDTNQTGGSTRNQGQIEMSVTDEEYLAIDIGVPTPMSAEKSYDVKAIDATGDEVDIKGDPDLDVSSQDPAVATVDEGAGVVEDNAPGTATIEAEFDKPSGGTLTATTTVTVQNDPAVYTDTVTVPKKGNGDVTVTFQPPLEDNPITDWVPIKTGGPMRLTPDDENESVGIVERSGPNCGAVNWPNSGTSSDPHKIDNVDKLQCIQFDGYYDNDDHFELTEDIAAHGTRYWDQRAFAGDFGFGGDEYDDVDGFSPIGPKGHNYVDNPDDPAENQPEPFNGNFDGKGHIIDSLYIDRNDRGRYAGLFGATAPVDFDGSSSESVIENVVIEDATVQGSTSVGILAGQVGGTVKQSRVDGDVTGDNQLVGGMIGDGIDADIDNELVASGTVTGGPQEEFGYGVGEINDEGIGGIIGRASGNTDVSVGYVQDIVVGGPNHVGGITGTSSYIQSDFRQMYSTAGEGPGSAKFGSIVGRVLASGDTFEDSVFWDSTVESDADGAIGNPLRPGLDSGDVTLDWQENTTSAMQGPSVLPSDSSFDYTQYPGVKQGDAQGAMAELDWSIWQPVYDTEKNTAAGTVDIVNEGYPIFEWESEGFITVDIVDIGPDLEPSSPTVQFRPGPEDATKMKVDVEVENVGETTKTQNILLVDPRKDSEAVVDTRTVTLNPGQTKTLTDMTWTTSKNDELGTTQSPSEAEVVVQSEDFLDSEGVELLKTEDTNILLPDSKGLDANETVDVFERIKINGSETNGIRSQFDITSDDGSLHVLPNPDQKFGDEELALLADGRVVDRASIKKLKDKTAGGDLKEVNLEWTPQLGQSGTVELTVQVVGTDVKVSDTIFVAAPAKSFSDAGLSPINTGVDIISGSG